MAKNFRTFWTATRLANTRMNPSALDFCGIIRAFGRRGLCAVRWTDCTETEMAMDRSFRTSEAIVVALILLL